MHVWSSYPSFFYSCSLAMNRATRYHLLKSFFIQMQNTRADDFIYWTETSCDREKEDGKFVRSQFVDKGKEERERERQRTLTSK